MGVSFPLPYVYLGDGQFSAATPYFAKRCDKEFTEGQRYDLVQHQERSQTSHDQQFAWLNDAWMNLPENLKDLYPTPVHLRKRALIEAGYYDEDAVDCGSKAAALRVAAFVRKKDDFSLVLVRGTFVLVRTAKSQSYRAMDRKTFQASKSAVIEIVACMIGVTPETLKANEGQAA